MDAGRHPILPQDPPDHCRLAGAAAKRIEEHRQIAARGLVQELAEALGGIGIDVSFRCNPFTAMRSTRVRLARRDEEDQRVPHNLGEEIRLARCTRSRSPRRRVSRATGKHGQ
jgi:hypothetical protein